MYPDSLSGRAELSVGGARFGVMQQRSDRFHVQVSVGDDVVEMWATGEIDVATVGVLRAALWAAPGRRLLRLDLSGVRLLSAAGVRALIAGHRRARACGGELVLVDPAPMVARVLHVTGLDRVIPVRESVAAGSPALAPLVSASRVVVPLVAASGAGGPVAPVPAVRVLTRIAPVAAVHASSLIGHDAFGVRRAVTAPGVTEPLEGPELPYTPASLVGPESTVTSPEPTVPEPLGRALGSLVPVAEASSTPMLACA